MAVLVGDGDGGLGPRCRGDDGGVGMTGWLREMTVLVGDGDGGLGPRCRGDDGLVAGMMGRGGWQGVLLKVGCFHGNCGLVSCGDEGLGPRFRGDDGGLREMAD